MVSERVTFFTVYVDSHHAKLICPRAAKSAACVSPPRLSKEDEARLEVSSRGRMFKGTCHHVGNEQEKKNLYVAREGMC